MTNISRVREYQDLVKNENNKAVLNTNKDMLREHKNRRLYYHSLNKRIDDLEKQVNQLLALVGQSNSNR